MPSNAIRHRVVVAGGSLAGHTVVCELDRHGFDGNVVWARGETDATYSKPALSKEFMQGRMEVDDLVLPAPGGSMDLDTRPDGVEAVDSESNRVRINGQWVGYDSLFICTGARALVPEKFTQTPGVYALRTLADAGLIREHVDTSRTAAVVGAGLVGSEMASSLRMLGLEVHLIEQSALPMEQVFGEDLARFASDLHRDRGVKLHMSTVVHQIGKSSSGVTVDLGQAGTLEVDMVILGLGARPNEEWLAGSGVATNNGVLCHPSLETLRPGVYAAGDVARWHHPVFGQKLRVEHWTNASAQARHVVNTWAARLRGDDPEPYVEVPYFWSDQHGLKYQMIGHAGGHDEVRASSDAHGRPFVTFHRQDRLIAAVGVNSPRAVMGARDQVRQEAR